MLARFIERLLEARSMSQIGVVFQEAMIQLGFDHALYAAHFMLTVPRSVLRENPIVFSNLPEELMEELHQMPNLNRDPCLQWVLASNVEISARDLLDLHGGTSPTLALARQHGLDQAQFISLRDKVLNSAGMVVVIPHRHADARTLAERWTRSGRDVRILSWVMHMRIATMSRSRAATTLTPRQREVLTWRSAGKTVGEIATILGITPATVEKHMRLARESLGVVTTPQAVLKAHVTHQLFQPAPLDFGNAGRA